MGISTTLCDTIMEATATILQRLARDMCRKGRPASGLEKLGYKVNKKIYIATKEIRLSRKNKN